MPDDPSSLKKIRTCYSSTRLRPGSSSSRIEEKSQVSALTRVLREELWKSDSDYILDHRWTQDRKSPWANSDRAFWKKGKKPHHNLMWNYLASAFSLSLYTCTCTRHTILSCWSHSSLTSFNNKRWRKLLVNNMRSYIDCCVLYSRLSTSFLVLDNNGRLPFARRSLNRFLVVYFFPRRLCCIALRSVCDEAHFQSVEWGKIHFAVVTLLLFFNGQ